MRSETLLVERVARPRPVRFALAENAFVSAYFPQAMLDFLCCSDVFFFNAARF